MIHIAHSCKILLQIHPQSNIFFLQFHYLNPQSTFLAINCIYTTTIFFYWIPFKNHIEYFLVLAMWRSSYCLLSKGLWEITFHKKDLCAITWSIFKAKEFWYLLSIPYIYIHIYLSIYIYIYIYINIYVYIHSVLIPT